MRTPAGWQGDGKDLWRHIACALHGCVALLGEHVDNPGLRDDAGTVAPGDAVRILRDAGVPAIVTVTGRDRDLTAARFLIQTYRDAGATAIHCVTGDHPASIGLDRPALFGAESMTLVATAVSEGIPATVGESPSTPGQRPKRLAAKQQAGASACILNHGGDVEDLISFADACRATGTDLPLIAPVAMVGDTRSALALANFPGLCLPSGLLQSIVNAAQPTEQGLRSAASFAHVLSASGRFAGVNLSGPAGGNDPWERLHVTVQFIERVREAWVAAPAAPSTEFRAYTGLNP